MKNVLILFTAEFPYGKSETFLETEIDYLSKGFDEVIVISRSGKDKSPRSVPNNINLISVRAELSSQEKFKAIFNVFDSRFREELRIIKSIYNIRASFGILKTMLISLQQGKRLQKVLKSQLPLFSPQDKVVVYSYWCDDAALACAMEKEKSNRITAISRIHRWDVYFEESKVNYLPFRTFLSEQLDKIFSISSDGIEYATTHWKVDRNIFGLSHLGINYQSGILRANQSNLRIVSCSNIIPVKRLGLLVEALKNMGETKLEWFHFGDGPERMRIEEKVDGLPKTISVFMMGRIPNKEIYENYKNLKPDIFINVSSSEGIPVSIMEAMSFGIPVIATDVGGTSEIVNEDNGYLLSSDPTAEEVSSTIEKFHQLSNEDIENKRKASYSTWENKYNAQKNYSEFVEDILKL